MATFREIAEHYGLSVEIDSVILDRPARGHLVIPGLELTGFFEGHPEQAVLLFTMRECHYLSSLPAGQAGERLDELCQRQPQLLIGLGELSLAAQEFLRNAAVVHSLPLIFCDPSRNIGVCDLKVLINPPDLPRQVISGTMMEVHGLGVIVTGESGVGKSECALELIRRGHRLVADDVIQLQRLPGLRLHGSTDEKIGHHMEIRGIGIIDVRALFGIAAVLPDWPVDLVIRLRSERHQVEFDRLGVDRRSMELLGIAVTELEIPVRSGRNLAIEVEVAVLNETLKNQGHHSARRFLGGLMAEAMGGGD